MTRTSRTQCRRQRVSHSIRHGSVAVEVALSIAITITISGLLLWAVKLGAFALQTASAVFIGWPYL